MGNGNHTVNCAGQLTNFAVTINTPPGSLHAWNFDIIVNNNTSIANLTCQISGASATTCGPVAGPLNLASGSTIDVRVTPSATPSTATITNWTATFTWTGAGIS